jgi:hypothetical protein
MSTRVCAKTYSLWDMEFQEFKVEPLPLKALVLQQSKAFLFRNHVLLHSYYSFSLLSNGVQLRVS